MNIISNNCVGGRIYQLLNIQYENPFIWSLVTPKDFIYLINHYDDINFYKRELKNDNGLLSIIVDNKIEITFIHHRFGKYDVPTKILDDNNQMKIYYKDIENYLLDCYDKRVCRMVKPPIFIINDRLNNTRKGIYTFNDISLLNHINTKYDVIYSGENSTDSFKYVYTKNNDSTGLIAKELINKYPEIFHE